jgi:Domain of Unknown Function with PDB structure (DUF3857)/Transglutaminase-like superfamily
MRILRAALLLLALAAGAQAADDIPVWVREATTQKIPDYPAKVSAVVLLSEESVVVDPDGRRVMRERGVIRVLQAGDEKIFASRTYNNKSGRIRDFQGWLIPPSGKVATFAKSSIVDFAVQEGVYEEEREKVLQCNCPQPGSVFAWEAIEEEKTLFTQYQYFFQQRSPVLTSRFMLTLPAGWEVKGTTFNQDPLVPKVAGSIYSWELRNLAPIESEDYSPSLSGRVPRLAVSYFPPSDNSAGLRGLRDWASVSLWLTSLVDPPAEVSEAIRTKAAQLTSGAATEMDKIRAIASFVQQTRYVAIELNLTRGGGYTPRRADDVLAKSYGDCKDKATLMRALLKAAGIGAYLTTVTADDRTYVRPEWASPMQFNHAIVAVQVSDAVSVPTVVESKTLGRLLIFDPTDPLTPVGDLPRDEQDSYALVIAAANGSLIKLPVLTADSNRVESSIEGILNDEGQLQAQVERRYFGQSGIAMSSVEKSAGIAALKKRLERAFSRRVPGSSLSDVTSETRGEEKAVSVRLKLSADRFGQLMQRRLLVVRPGLLTSGGEYGFNSKQRTAPVELEMDLRRDSIHIKIPAGFKADELPAPQKIESPYGTLEATWTVKDDDIVMKETLEIRETVVPAAEYSKVREFFDAVAGAHAAPVVFVKQ